MMGNKKCGLKGFAIPYVNVPFHKDRTVGYGEIWKIKPTLF